MKKFEFIKEEFKEEFEKEHKEEIELENLLNKALINPDKEYVKPPTYLGIKDQFYFDVIDLFTPGNISAIKGKAKSKKTFLQSIFVAACALNKPLFEIIIPSLPKNKEDIIVFDTEQSKYHTYRVRNRITKLCNSKVYNLYIYSLRGLSALQIIKLISYVLILHPNVGIMFIDQVGDLAKSMNDETEAVSIVRFLELLTTERDMHICCIIHQNKGDNYATGWLGSQIMKKAEIIIDVAKEPRDRRISHVTCDMSRAKEFEGFSFQINDNGLPEIIGQESLEKYNTDMAI